MAAKALLSGTESFYASWFSTGALAVWRRNYKYFTHTWLLSVFWIIIEPSLYLGAIGFGLGQFVDEVSGHSYLDFYYPALLATTAMFVPFFEATYGSFTKMVHQKTFNAIMLTPIGPDEIVRGEILWAASKGFLGVIGVIIVASLFGLGHSLGTVGSLGILALTCWLFAALGMLATSLARNYDSFIYATSGFIIPMSLFSGTYFPLEDFPAWVHRAAYLLPLTHSVQIIRGLMLGEWEHTMILNLLVLVVLCFWVSQIAINRIVRKLYS